MKLFLIFPNYILVTGPNFSVPPKNLNYGHYLVNFNFFIQTSNLDDIRCCYRLSKN